MNAAFSAQAFQPAFAWDRPAQFATAHPPGTVGRSRPGTSRAGYSRQRAAVGGEYGPDGILRAGGKFVPGAEGPPDAGPEAQQPQVENSGALQPQQAGDEDYGQTSGYMPDEGGGAMPAQPGQQPAAQAAPLPKPLRDHVIDYPSLGDEPQHQVKAGMAWLRQPIGPLPHQDDEHAWASLGLTPETLPGMLLHSVGNRGHKFAQWFGKGVAQVLGDDAALVSQVPIQKAFLFATLHPDIQEHFRRYSKDPLGKSINGSETEAMRTLTRAVNTLKDNPGFGQDYGRAAALGIAEAMQPPPNPDLQQFAINLPNQDFAGLVRGKGLGKHKPTDPTFAPRADTLPLTPPEKAAIAWHVASAHGPAREIAARPLDRVAAKTGRFREHVRLFRGGDLGITPDEARALATSGDPHTLAHHTPFSVRDTQANAWAQAKRRPITTLLASKGAHLGDRPLGLSHAEGEVIVPRGSRVRILHVDERGNTLAVMMPSESRVPEEYRSGHHEDDPVEPTADLAGDAEADDPKATKKLLRKYGHVWKAYGLPAEHKPPATKPWYWPFDESQFGEDQPDPPPSDPEWWQQQFACA